MAKSNGNSSAGDTDKQHNGKATEAHESEPLNLRKPFPLAFRSILRRSILWILSFIILVLIITALDTLRPTEESMATKIFLLSCLAFLVVGIVLLVGKLIYEYLYHYVYYYGLELEHLVISSGLIFKTRASFPIAHLSDVYLHQSPIDLIFGISNLRVTTPSPVSEFGAIEGLGHGRAIALQNLLLALVNTTAEHVDIQSATDSLKTMQATDESSIFSPSPAEKDPPRMSREMVPDSFNQSSPEESSSKAVSKGKEKAQESVGKEKQKLSHSSNAIGNSEELLSELQHTKHILEETRYELVHTEELLEKTKTTLEHALSSNGQALESRK